MNWLAHIALIALINPFTTRQSQVSAVITAAIATIKRSSLSRSSPSRVI